MKESTFQIIRLLVDFSMVLVTLAILVFAIWKENIQNYLAGPKLELKLHNARGSYTTQNGTPSIYYHIKIKNKRERALAKHVEILCTDISRRAPDGSFKPEPLGAPVQLTWAYSHQELFLNIHSEKICDIGHINKSNRKFLLSLYRYPNNFRGWIKANMAMRISLKAFAENFTSKSPYILEISYDGEWSDDREEMQKHLVIKEIEE